MKKRYSLCVFGFLLTLLLGMSTVTHATPPIQVPTPTPDAAFLKAMVDALLDEGVTLYREGDYQGALETFHAVLLLYQQLSDTRGEVMTLTAIALVYGHLGDYRQALAYSEQALSIRREIGDRYGEATGKGRWGKH